MNKRNIILFLILIGFLAIATSCSIAFGEGVEELSSGNGTTITASGTIYSNSTYTVSNVTGYYNWNTMTSPSSSYAAFRSTNNGVHSSYAVMKVTFNTYVSSFTFGIRSYAESNYDYVVVSSKNGSIPTSGTGYSSTKGNQSSGTSLSYYTGVTFSNLYSGDYFYVVYLKDSSSSSGDDTGYVVLPVSTSSSSSSSSTSTVSTPVITDRGTYYYDTSKHVITISCSTSGATIRYTTNGNTPTTSSSSYSLNYDYYQTTSGSYYYGILVSNGSTVKAMGTYSGYNNSSVSSYSVPSGSGGSSSYTVSNVSGSSYYSWTTMSSPSSSYNAYRSTNQGQANTSSVMKVTFNSYVSSFTFYIRSYTDSEKNYDYVIVSNVNSSVPSTVSGNKASTYGTSQSGTGVSYYTAVTFNSLYAGDYFYVVFYKDSIYDSGDDTGYVLLPK